MKKIYFILFILFGFSITQAQNNVGIGTNTPNASAKLDITATDKGLLIPRVNLTGTGDVATIASPATGLMVFNQTAAGSGTTAVMANTFYYWNSTKWVKLEASLGDDWIKAATATTPATKTDDQYVTGKVGIGDFSATSPTRQLDVISNVANQGVMTVSNPNSAGFAGIYFNEDYGTYRGHVGYVASSSTFGGPGLFQIASGNRPLIFSATNGAETYNEVARFNNTNGNMGIGTTSIPNESRLVLGAMDASSEGGQLQLNAPGGSYTTAYFLDNYQNKLRFLSGTNTATSATRMTLDNNGNFGINIAPTAKLHSYTNTASQNAIQGENYGTTNGTSWGSTANFAGVTGYGASGSAQYQTGVYGYQIGSGANSGGVVGAYSTAIYGALGYTDNNSNNWGVYNLGGKGSYTGENVVAGRGLVSGKIQIKQGPGTGVDNNWHTVELDAGYGASAFSGYCTGSYLDGDAKIQGIDIAGLLTTSSTWYAGSNTFGSSSASSLNAGAGANCDNCTHYVNCPDGYIATGWQVYANSQWDYYMKLKCTSLVSGFTTTETGMGVESVTNFPNANADNFTHVGTCPAGTFIKGMSINAASYLDNNLRVYCTGIKKN